MTEPVIRAAGRHDIASLRDRHCEEMRCQVVHDSIHARPGWTREYAIDLHGTPVGYGSVAVGGPWQGTPTLYEFYVVPECRTRVFDLFTRLLASCGAAAIATQSNDRLLTVMLHTFATEVRSESILFEAGVPTSLAPRGAVVREATPDDADALGQHDLDRAARWVVTFDGDIAGAGGVLDHYNRPYADIYMAVAEPFRLRGLGAYLVQELKARCREGGRVPAARCRVSNVASRRTLQRAGFVPCGHCLTGTVSL